MPADKVAATGFVEVSGSRCGFSWQYPRLPVECAREIAAAAVRFFRKVLKAEHTQAARVITVDKNAAYPAAMETLK